MRYLGLDLGTKTLGLALSDQTGIIASSFKTVRYNDISELTEILANLLVEYDVRQIVLGFPKNMNNTIGPRAEETLLFKDKIEEELNINIILQDERLSTIQAHNCMIEANMSRKKRKEKVDSLAATIILQTYLDRRDKNER